MKTLSLTIALAVSLGAAACGEPSTPATAPAVPAPAAGANLSYSFGVIEAPASVGLGSARTTASQGGLIILVHYTITNMGETPATAPTTPAVRLYDPAGVEISPDVDLTFAAASDPRNRVDVKAISDLNPGITTNAAVAFEVAETRWKAGGWSVGIARTGPEGRLPIPPLI